MWSNEWIKKIKKQEIRIKELEAIIKEWKDGDRISKFALDAFVESHNVECEKGKEIDTDETGYFCECLDPIND